MILLVWILVAIIALVILYFFMTGGKASPDCGWLKKMKFAHRGLHNKEFPENSIKAFENALQHGYAIELDVHLSKDGNVVVFHDFELERMTGVSGVVEDYSLDELKQMKLGGTQETLPSLHEVLELVDGKVPLLIETKNEGQAGQLEVRLHEVLKNYHGKYAVQSFSPFSMAWFRKNDPDTPRGQLSCFFSVGAEKIPKWQRFMLRHLLTNFLCRPNFISYGVEGAGIPVLKRLRRKELPVLIWTVRSPQEQEKACMYADSVIFENFIA